MSISKPHSAPQHAVLTDWLTRHAPAVQHGIQSAGTAESRWSLIRLAAFLLLAIAWYPVRSQPFLALLVPLASAAFFAWTIWRHRIARAEKVFLKLQSLVEEESFRRLTRPVTAIGSTTRPADVPSAKAHATSPFLPRGRTWLLTEQERDDLDFYAAPVGLFGLLNRTSTDVGAVCLRDHIENLCLEPDHILTRQEAVRWLAEHHAQRLSLAARLAGLRGLDKQMAGFEIATRSANSLMSSPASWILRLWSLISFSTAILSISKMMTTGNRTWALPMGALAAINVLLWLPYWTKVRSSLVQWQRVADFLQGYLNITRQAGDLPEQTILSVLSRKLATLSHRQALPGIIRWLNWSAAGGFAQMVMDLFAFYEIHVLEGIQRHVLPHREGLIAGLTAIAELEALLSLACFAAEQPGTSWPQVAGDMQVSMQCGRHPLIDPVSAVPNSLQLARTPNLWIITGSNMSGKSTFLRMVGVNIVLAQIGCVVVVDRMIWSPMRLITDLRVRDNLSKGESYFLAEVRQLRRMLIPPTGAEPLLGLVDEPFRGTNHCEQHAATRAIIEQLIEADGVFLIATHDATVTRIADDVHAQNRHFQEQLGDRELTFDYQLRPGPAQSRNAIRVLDREHYPADLVQRALSYAQNDRASDSQAP